MDLNDNTPVLLGGTPTMSSREIADLVESRHDKVKQSIERLVARGVIVQPPMGDEHFFDAKSRPRAERVYRLEKRDSYVVVAQLSPEFTARLVDRWAELEQQVRVPTLPDLSNPDVLLALVTDYARDKKALQAQVEADKPKTTFYDQYVNADGLYGLQNAGRALGAHPNKFISWLKQDYLFYQGTALVPRVRFIQMGVFEVKSEIVDEKARYRTFVTAKGLTYLAKRMPESIKLHPGDGEAA